METLTVEKAHELLKRAVAEKGEDYVYQPETVGSWGRKCRYFEPDGSPSCIVGHVLAYAGVHIDPLTENNALGTSLLTYERVVAMSPVALEALSAAQDAQDDGLPWGAALAAFERVLVEQEPA